jgi:hypothetical protein
MATHKPFRELLQPGTNFEFIGKQRLWLTISLIVSLACIVTLFVNERTRFRAREIREGQVPVGRPDDQGRAFHARDQHPRSPGERYLGAAHRTPALAGEICHWTASW